MASKWSSHFLVKMHVYSTSFRNKSNACFFLISNSWKNGKWRPRWRPWLVMVTSQTGSQTPDHRLHCLTKSSLTLFTPCPLPDGGKLSLSDRWLRTGPVVRSYASRERNYEKLWWTKFKIKHFASGCDGTWDFRNIEGKDKLSADPLTAILAGG